jgi:transposase InsO family protein
MAIDLIEEAVRAGAREAPACELLGISSRTLRRWRSGESLTDQRATTAAERDYPQALCADERAQIIELCNSEAYKSLPPSQIVPRLADEGRYLASESTFYRVLRQHNQVSHRGRARPPKTVTKPDALVARGPNQVWSWDITYLPGPIKGQFYRLYMIIDIYSRMVVGWEIHLDERAEHAASLITKSCLRQGITRNQLVLHSDNGAPMKGATMLATLQKMGVMPSFSRPSVSDDNPYSEALFHTLKYTPAYPEKAFTSIEAARDWVQRFVTWYNREHRHSGIKFVTPKERHKGLDHQVLAQREAIYKKARESHPERWKGRGTRNWSHCTEVWLNPPKEHDRHAKNMQLAA